MNSIFTKLLYEIEEKRSLILVSVVSQEGSSPRGVGAQMLVGDHGRILGSVGGGAVELLCEKYAQTLLEEKKSGIQAFSLRKNAKTDIGMVCGGDIVVWFQYVDAALPFWREFSGKLLDMLHDRQAGWLALHEDGALPALFDGEGNLLFGEFEERAKAWRQGTYLRTEHGFLFPLPVQDRAVIFGGGHCSQALVPILNSVGFRVTVMDCRPEYSDPELFPKAERTVCGDFTKISDYLSVEESDYIVIMTNGHSHDLDVQLQILENPHVYVGVIGSKSKKAFINQKLREAGISEERIASVHSPIGTPIKAVTPEEIAISIAGEMVYERALLREKHGVETHGCPMH